MLTKIHSGFPMMMKEVWLIRCVLVPEFFSLMRCSAVDGRVIVKKYFCNYDYGNLYFLNFC
jgi:hypothetical protein